MDTERLIQAGRAFAADNARYQAADRKFRARTEAEPVAPDEIYAAMVIAERRLSFAREELERAALAMGGA